MILSSYIISRSLKPSGLSLGIVREQDVSFVSKAVEPLTLNRFYSNIDVRKYVLVSGIVCFKVLVQRSRQETSRSV